MLFQISYELKAENKDYTPLYSAIKKLGEWMRPLDSVWYVKTEQPVSDIYKSLLENIEGQTDKIIISEVNSPVIGGRASSEFWKWLKEYFEK